MAFDWEGLDIPSDNYNKSTINVNNYNFTVDKTNKKEYKFKLLKKRNKKV